MAIGAAHVGEKPAALPDAFSALWARWIDRNRCGQLSQVSDQVVTLGVGHVQSLRLLRGSQWRDRLRMSGDLQAELVGTRGADELTEGGDLCLPAKTADLAVRSAADPAPNFGGLVRGHFGQHIGRNGVDSTRPEEGRGIPLRHAEGDALRRLEADRSVLKPLIQCCLLLHPSDLSRDGILAIPRSTVCRVVAARAIKPSPP